MPVGTRLSQASEFRSIRAAPQPDNFSEPHRGRAHRGGYENMK